MARKRQNIREVFGARLRQLRTARGFTQEQLALRSGLDRSYVGQVERGEKNISLENIEKLARALAVNLARLLEPAESDPGIGGDGR